MSMSELVLIERDAYDTNGVVKLTLNRPDAFNALSEAMLEALEQGLKEIAGSDARVVVLAGAGRAFCAGHDLKEMRAEPALDYYRACMALPPRRAANWSQCAISRWHRATRVSPCRA
jgi:enoyl-CoA hydratase/carnithine racemase